jgi:hypothetical protein
MPRAAAGFAGARRPAPAEARIESQLGRPVPSPGWAKSFEPLRAKAAGTIVPPITGPPESTSNAGVADMSENDADAVPNEVRAG